MARGWTGGAALIALSLAATASAQDSSNLPPAEKYRLRVQYREYRPGLTGEAQKGSADNVGSVVDVMDDLAIADERTFDVRGAIQFKPGWKLRGAYMPFDYKGDTEVSSSFNYGETRYLRFEHVVSTMKGAYYGGDLEWDFLKGTHGFLGAVVGLGGLGVVTRVTLDIQPSYQVRQHVYENLPFGELEKSFEAIMSSGYSVSLFTNWQKNNVSEVWVKSLIVEGKPAPIKPELYGATPARRNLHPIVELAAENCTEQMGVPGPWHERLPHFRMNFTPSSGKELQSEYFVPFSNAFAALKAINSMGDKWIQDLFISEVRTIAADDLWMSPCYKRPSVAIHFTWKQNTDSVMKLIPVVEEQLAPFGARPHWGKLFTIPPAQLRSRYERYADFQELLRLYDPKGKFRNEFLDLNLA